MGYSVYSASTPTADISSPASSPPLTTSSTLSPHSTASFPSSKYSQGRRTGPWPPLSPLGLPRSPSTSSSSLSHRFASPAPSPSPPPMEDFASTSSAPASVRGQPLSSRTAVSSRTCTDAAIARTPSHLRRPHSKRNLSARPANDSPNQWKGMRSSRRPSPPSCLEKQGTGDDDKENRPEKTTMLARLASGLRRCSSCLEKKKTPPEDLIEVRPVHWTEL